MANEKRLIDANALKMALCTEEGAKALGHSTVKLARVSAIVDAQPTIDAAEVVRIEEVKQEILSRIDMFIAEYKRTSLNCNDRDGGKAEAMVVARRLVNAALTDLCTNCGAKMDGGNEDV